MTAVDAVGIGVVVVQAVMIVWFGWWLRKEWRQ